VAAATSSGDIFLENDMDIEWLKPGAFFGSILYALIGVVVFWLSFVIIDKLTPYNLWQELVEKQNVALAIVVGAMALGISVIVAAAVHG
jgi:putative membrane protein